jgi:hypothetical protein
MADKTTTKFATMGTSAVPAVNASGAPSRNTKTVPSQNSKGGMLDAATAAHRPNVNERLGAVNTPQVVDYRNAAEAGLTQRNVYIVPPAKGTSDFWNARQAAGN